ncbi:predicted protein [Uncinocarpus reesii 1704]|uniref:Uncharacterized protein n=1 Tax=Uncinocarpus reesii (strain UAMH 1704) TaxID=336963 RepID=C4JHV9_UNCRE|nr:uncharacterized protein UREG_01384 [Uncinocarpus reesii 1704]EEP76535.1 predicted protein [Uncinocarpus reesii 1704]
MEPSVEILVHVSAPSGAEDDANHRALADAYLHFEPVTKIKIYPDDEDDGLRANSPNDLDVLSQINNDLEGGSTANSTGYLTPPSWKRVNAEYGLDEPSIYGVQHGRHSKGIPEGDTTEIDEDSFETPPETVPDSQPSLSPGWDAHMAANPDDEPTMGEISVLEPLPDTTGSQAEIADPVSSAVPPGSAFSSQASFESVWDVERNNSPGTGRVRAVQIDEPPSPSQDRASKRKRLSTATRDVASPFREPFLSSEATEISSPGPSGLTSLPDLPMEIRPPRPPMSDTARFTTHITPTLHMISEQLNPSRYFKPAYQARQLGKLERGYWQLRIPVNANKQAATSNEDDGDSTTNASTTSSWTGPTRPWTLDHFLRFWNYLAEFVGQHGRAGWGVWCYCDSAEGQPKVDSVQQLDVRVYAWGEIAAHIYLLLFLASHRAVKRVPHVQWRDGKGETIIRMA